MKNEHLSSEDFSAYLDGEAKYRDRLTQHLLGCPDCARCYAEYQKLSGELRAMPVAEAHPAFVTRVMGAVKEAGHVRSLRWVRIAAPLAAAALVLVFISGVTLLSLGPSEPAPWAALDIDALTAEIEQRLARGEGASFAEAEEPYAVPEADETAVVNSIVLIATADPVDPFAGSWTAQDDLQTMLSELEPEETEAFKELLVEYTKEG